MTTSNVNKVSASATTGNFEFPPRLCVDFGEDGYLEARPFYDLGKALETLVRPLLGEPLKEVEPNWYSLDLVFSTEAGQHELKEAKVNGPKLGTSDVSTLLRERVPRSVWYLLRAHVAVREQWTDGRVESCLVNTNYKFEFVPERTCLSLSDGDAAGYVKSVDKGVAELVSWSTWYEAGEEQHLCVSCERLEAEVLDKVAYVYTSVHYLAPGESATKRRAEQKEQRKEEQRLAREAYEANRPQREAEEAARQAERKKAEAEAYDALSPEEKEEYDERKARMAAQAAIIRSLAPLLPHP